MMVHMLTTVDNPHDPFTDPKAWYAFDFAQGYHTPGYLAEVAKVSENLPAETVAKEIEEAIDEIVKYNILGIYRKVSRMVA